MAKLAANHDRHQCGAALEMALSKHRIINVAPEIISIEASSSRISEAPGEIRLTHQYSSPRAPAQRLCAISSYLTRSRRRSLAHGFSK